MRCTERGARITYSPRSWVAVRRYCSSDNVSFPRRTTNAPLSCTVRTLAARINASMELLPSRDADGFDFVVALDRVHDVHPLGDLAEHGVDAVEMALRRMTDEELAAAGVLAGVRHRERPGDVLVRVLLRFALDRVPGTARADGAPAGLRVGVAALDHEVRDHTVELGPIVEARVGQLLKI